MLSSELVAAPEHVPICCLASALVAPPGSLPGAATPQDGKVIQRQAAVFLLLLLQDARTLSYPPLPQLLQQLQDAGAWGAPMAVHLVRVLQGLQTADDLLQLYDSISTWLLPRGAVSTLAAVEADQLGGIAQGSPVGMFLRRARLAFTQLTMQGIAQLLQGVQASLAAVVNPGSLSPAEQQPMQQVQLPGSDVVLELDPAAAATIGQALATHQVLNSSSVAAREGPTATAAAAVGAAGPRPAEGLVASSISRVGAPALRDASCLEQYLTKVVALVERQGPLLPSEVVAAAVGLLRPLAAQLSKLQYLDMALALQHKDVAGLHDALHRYFDLNGMSVAGSGELTGPIGEIIQERHHNCLLTLSSAQASLGATSEALHALREGLRQAQQHGDQSAMLQCTAALTRVMGQTLGLNSWQQSRTGAAGPLALELRNRQEQQQLADLLRQCLRTGQQLACPHIVAYATAALVRFALLHTNEGLGSVQSGGGNGGGGSSGGGGGGAAAAADASAVQQAQQGLKDVCLLQYHTAMAAAGGMTATAAAAAAAAAPGGLPAAAGQLYNPSEVFPSSSGNSSSRHRATAAAVSEAAATLHVLQAAAWRQAGCGTLAAVHALTAVLCYSSSEGLLVGGGAPSSSSSADRQLALAQLVTLVAEQQGPAAGEKVLALAAHLGGGSAASTPLAAAQLHVRGTQAARAGDVVTALAAARQLQELCDTAPCCDLQLKLMATGLQGRALAAGGGLLEAAGVLAAAFEEAAAAGLQVESVQLLVQQGEVALAAGDPAAALPYALSAALHCRQLHLDGSLLEAQLLLAKVWYALVPGGASWVLPLLQGLLQAAHSQGALRIEAEVQLLLAQVWLGCNSSQEGEQAAAVPGAPLQQQQLLAAAKQQGLMQAPGVTCALDGSPGSHSGSGLSLQHVESGLQQAGRRFEQGGCWQQAAEAWRFMALLYHKQGLADARNAAASRSLRATQCV